LRTANLAISFVDSLSLRTMILCCIGGDDAGDRLPSSKRKVWHRLGRFCMRIERERRQRLST
jgi:hypothetical protein